MVGTESFGECGRSLSPNLDAGRSPRAAQAERAVHGAPQCTLLFHSLQFLSSENNPGVETKMKLWIYKGLERL